MKMNLEPPITNEMDRMVQLILQLPYVQVGHAVEVIQQARAHWHKVFTIGNGGSASLASHFACDLAKNTRRPDKFHIKAISLVDNMALVSAWANDEGWDSVFREQLYPFIEKGDVVVGISASGNSNNILAAIEAANKQHAATIALTGGGGKLSELVGTPIIVPSRDVQLIENAHLIICHIITKCLKEM